MINFNLLQLKNIDGFTFQRGRETELERERERERGKTDIIEYKFKSNNLFVQN